MDWQSKSALIYHSVFDYPLTKTELGKWRCAVNLTKEKKDSESGVETESGYWYLDGKKDGVDRRIGREHNSVKKLAIAKSAVRLLGKVPSIVFIGITGALAMDNADKDSDIDLLIVSTKGTLWATRMIAYALLKLNNFPLRTPNQKEQEDRLCLNMWLEEDQKTWPKEDRNIYTAHEIVQIVSILDRNGFLHSFLAANAWTNDFWPNATRMSLSELRSSPKPFPKSGRSLLLSSFTIFILKAGNLLAYIFQKLYMGSKKTREVVAKNKAIFHPVDWGRRVKEQLLSS